jgi:hypothetical protein
VANKGVQISKVLVSAFFLSFLTILVTATVTFLVMVLTPDTVYHKILQWMLLNRFNPEVYYTDYYRRLSQYANEEDWMIVTPLSYLLGGAVFGWVLSSKRPQTYILKTSAITSLVFTAAVLIICYFSSDILQVTSQEAGIDFKAMPATASYYVMGGVQTVYWTLFFFVGSLFGYLIRTSKSRRLANIQHGSNVPSVPV